MGVGVGVTVGLGVPVGVKVIVGLGVNLGSGEVVGVTGAATGVCNGKGVRLTGPAGAARR